MPFDPTLLAPLGFGATFVLAIVASLFVTGVIVPGKLLDRAEKARDSAMTTVATLAGDVKDQGAATKDLTTELRESRLRGNR